MLKKGEKKNELSSAQPDAFDIGTPVDSKANQLFEFTGDKSAYVSLAEAATYTRFSQEYLSLLVRNKKIPAQKFGRNWKVRMQDVFNYVVKVEGTARAREAKKTQAQAGAVERGLAKTLNTLSAKQAEIYTPIIKDTLFNIGRHKFQSVMASFLILTTVATASFFWLAPVQAAKLENSFQRAAAAVVQGIAKGADKLQAKASAKGIALLEQGAELLEQAEIIIQNRDDSLSGELRRAAVGVVLKVGQLGGLVNSGLTILEERAETRQHYVLSSFSKAVTDSLRTIDNMSADLAAGVEQTFGAPLAFIPTPIQYALDSGMDAANNLASAG
ncbi:MAG: helix-turn-helix domain-containing protein, partial [Patescibacteria group bacterium]